MDERARERMDRILFIVNPAAKNGKGENYLPIIADGMEHRGPYDVMLTTAQGDALRMAREDTGHDVIIAVSGDGTAHEIINGIMRRPANDRPAFGVLPVGSGNDFCRTLGIPLGQEHAREALDGLLDGVVVPMDLGMFNDSYFLESLSFGLDAAIAIRTMDLRKKTDESGTMLYLHAGLQVLRNEYRAYPVHFSLDGADPVDKDLLMLAFTVGATYGGGFAIAPDADPCDGMLNYCFTDAVGKIKGLGVLGLAMKGKHGGLRYVNMGRTRDAVVEFEMQVPAQADGEEVLGDSFRIRILPKAYQVLVPRGSRVATARIR
ncbi:MAG: diacylglycerol kinase family lipid kinase [Coriobacteriales bacterium]|nr:diacylglycerol kinase family lipid kinase [Coriobacteriales bacterium]